MKHLKHLKHSLTASVFVSLIIFMSCGDDDKPPTNESPADKQAKLLAFEWDLSANGAKLESAAQSEWDDFTLTFSGDGSGGSYTSSGADAAEVWPASGTWKFGDDNDTIVRNDGVEIDISSLTSSGLTLAFEIETSGSNRSFGTEGNWSFEFTR